jgi:ABC-type antimicrobial peptide transport system permease subunit
MFEVVGIVHDVMSYGLLSRTKIYELYMPMAQQSFGPMTVVMRTTTADPSWVIPVARQVVGSIDPRLPVSHVQTLESVVAQSVSQPRLLSSLTSLFAALAGLLAAVGIYGVMAYNVQRQRREFGIRLALGADPARVRAMVVRRALLLGTLGLSIGAGAALLLTRTMEALLSQVRTADPAVFTVTGLALLAVTVLAGYLPARQASRTDPLVVLRAE